LKSEQAHPFSPAVLDEREAAHYIGMSTAWLRRCRMTGASRLRAQGPVFVKVPGGRAIRYRIEDLDRWLADNVKKGAI
jgi:predicted DNA-binding transcriptional regulator AlpA